MIKVADTLDREIKKIFVIGLVKIAEGQSPGVFCGSITTGQGNIIGNPIVPVVKLTANPNTAATMSEHVDLDVSGILTGEMTLDEAAAATADMVVRTANGRLTAAEALGHVEYVLTKLYRSA